MFLSVRSSRGLGIRSSFTKPLQTGHALYTVVGGNIYWTKEMIDTLSTPWDFHNNDKKVFSPDGLQKLTYSDLGEIAMGAPIGGECFLETADKIKIKIHDWCGGPPAWETSGTLVAIPIWTRDFGTIQKMGVLDSNKKELKIFSRTFRVLDIRSFDKNIVSGYDSPVHKTTILTFDVEKEHIEKIIRFDK